MVGADGSSGPEIGATADRPALLAEAVTREYTSLLQFGLLWANRLGLASDGAGLRALATEVVHEAVARAMSRPEAFDPERSARAWLNGFVKNVLRERRHRSIRDRLRVVEAPRDPEGDDPVNWLDGLAAAATRDDHRLLEWLDLVKPAEAHVIRLAYVDGRNGPALAAALGVSEGAARVRLSRAISAWRAADCRAERTGEELP